MSVKVRLLVSMAGVDEVHRPGDELTISAEAAKAWEEAGLAVPVKGQAPKPAPSGKGKGKGK